MIIGVCVNSFCLNVTLQWTGNFGHVKLRENKSYFEILFGTIDTFILIQRFTETAQDKNTIRKKGDSNDFYSCMGVCAKIQIDCEKHNVTATFNSYLCSFHVNGKPCTYIQCILPQPGSKTGCVTIQVVEGTWLKSVEMQLFSDLKALGRFQEQLQTQVNVWHFWLCDIVVQPALETPPGLTSHDLPLVRTYTHLHTHTYTQTHMTVLWLILFFTPTMFYWCLTFLLFKKLAENTQQIFLISLD